LARHLLLLMEWQPRLFRGGLHPRASVKAKNPIGAMLGYLATAEDGCRLTITVTNAIADGDD
jgi:hypothetical protein